MSGTPKDPHVTLIGNANPLVSLELVAAEYGALPQSIRGLMAALKVPVLEVDGREWLHLYAIERAIFEKTVLIPDGFTVDDYMRLVSEYTGAARTEAIRESLRCAKAAYDKLARKLIKQGSRGLQVPRRPGRKPRRPRTTKRFDLTGIAPSHLRGEYRPQRSRRSSEVVREGGPVAPAPAPPALVAETPAIGE